MRDGKEDRKNVSVILENIVRELEGEEWSPAEFRAIVQLGLHANWDTGETWIMQTTLARETGLNKSTISAAIKKAEGHEILSRTIRSRHGNITTYLYCFAPRLLKRGGGADKRHRDPNESDGCAAQAAGRPSEQNPREQERPSDLDEEHRCAAETHDTPSREHGTVPLSRNRTNSKNLLTEQGDHNGRSGPSQPDGHPQAEEKRSTTIPPLGGRGTTSLKTESEDPAESYPRKRSRFNQLRAEAREEEAKRVEPSEEPTTSVAASSVDDLDDVNDEEFLEVLDRMLGAKTVLESSEAVQSAIDLLC